MLFTEEKDLAEKKEKFIAGRFAQENCFGDGAVISWLENEIKSEKPDQESWVRILNARANSDGSHLGNKSRKDILYCFGMSMQNAQNLIPIDKFPHIQRLSALREIFQFDGYVTLEGVLFVLPNNDLLYVTEKGRGGTFSPSYLRSDVLESALLTWAYGKDGLAWSARFFLCEWLRRCLAYVRKEIVREFDMAVAVSEDGKKIIHADKVVLYITRIPMHTPHINMCTYGPNTFLQKKIIRGDFKRISSLAKSVETSREELIEIIRLNGDDNGCFLYDRIVAGFDSVRIFFCKADFHQFFEKI